MDLQAAKHHPGALSFLAIRNPRSQIYAEAPLRRLLGPFLSDCGASTPRFPIPHFHPSTRVHGSGVLKNSRRARGVLKRPRSVSALLFLTPF
jgi:hypothetical protein